MKLSQLAAKPQLIKMTLDDEDTIKEFGEPVEFYTWDRQPMDVFMQLASVSNKDPEVMIGIIRTLILDEEGKEIITKDAMLPSSVLLRVVGKVVDLLGK
jgi:hypothetical protein